MLILLPEIRNVVGNESHGFSSNSNYCTIINCYKRNVLPLTSSLITTNSETGWNLSLTQFGQISRQLVVEIFFLVGVWSRVPRILQNRFQQLPRHQTNVNLSDREILLVRYLIKPQAMLDTINNDTRTDYGALFPPITVNHT